MHLKKHLVHCKQGDKRAKGANRRLKTFDVQVKNLMSALQKIIESITNF